MGISLSHERYEQIKEIVVNLFTKYDVRCIPVSGFELATKMGIKVIPYSAVNENKRYLLFKQSEDGFCVLYENEYGIDEWRIYYNDERDYGRINNTIFHELGHIVLDHTQDSELAEKEVKFFAKYALAPPVLVHKLNVKDPIEIVDYFDISYEAARYAYSYYQKWLQRNHIGYTDYEERLLILFKDIA